MEKAPLLAAVAALAAIVDLFTRRSHFRYFADLTQMGSLPRSALSLPLNTLAVAGAASLVFTLHVFLAAPDGKSEAPRAIGRASEAFVRFMSGAAAALLLGALLTAALQPFAELEPGLVLIGTAAAQLLVSNLAFSTSRHRAPFASRAAALLLLVAALGAFLGFMLPAASGMFGAPTAAYRWGATLRRGGELAFLLVPLAFAFRTGRLAQKRRGLALAAAAFAAVAAAALVIHTALLTGSDFSPILYGVMRLEAFAGLSPRVYAFPLGVAAGVATLLALGGDSNARQRAAGLALYVAAGYSPLSPALLLTMALGAALLCRSVIAESPEGRGYPPTPLSGAAPEP